MSEPINDGGPVHPTPGQPARHGSYPSEDVAAIPATRGMSLRDYFAGQALAGYIANAVACDALAKSNQNTPKTYAFLSYEMADAMLKARTK